MNVNNEKVSEAVVALLAFHKKRKVEKKDVLQSPSKILLQISLWEVTANKTKTFRVNLPHSPFPTAGDAVLFVKDVPEVDSEMCVQHYKEMLADVEYPITIMPFKVLKNEYREFEAKRKLAKSYDIFLADDRVYHLLHQKLGKEFFKRKKYPAVVNLQKKNKKAEIESAIKATYFNLSNRGSSSSITFGHTDMTEDHLKENVLAAIIAVAKVMPGGWQNIKTLHLHTEKSVALPVYTNDVHKNWDKEKPANVSNEDLSKLKKQMNLEKETINQKKRKAKDLDPSEPLSKKSRRKKIKKLATNMKRTPSDES